MQECPMVTWRSRCATSGPHPSLPRVPEAHAEALRFASLLLVRLQRLRHLRASELEFQRVGASEGVAVKYADMQRLWTKFRVGEGCWLWLDEPNMMGYGIFWMDGRTVYAHRCVYETLVGPIPEGL